MNNQYPQSLYAYYAATPSEFEEKTNATRKALYAIGFTICMLLLIFPHIIPIPFWLMRIVCGIAVVYFAISLFTGGKDLINKRSGGKITDLAIKKFNMSVYTEDTILQAFSNKDFEFLARAEAAENQPLQLYIDEDVTGKTFYCLLRKYFSSSDFRGTSDVLVISGDEYDRYKNVIKSI